jgi:hypothetical protein
VSLVSTDIPPLELIRTLEDAGALSPSRLDLSSRPDLSVETCTSLAAFLGQINNSSRWWIADLLEYVEMRHGEFVAQVAEATGLAPQTIENILSIGRRVPPERRVDGVTFSVHAEVAALPPADQMRWLRVAKEERLTKVELRAKIKPELPPAVRNTLTCPHCGELIEM